MTKLPKSFILEYSNGLGSHMGDPELHELLGQCQQDRELGQSSYFTINRAWADPDSAELAILDRLEVLHDHKYRTVLVLIDW